MAFQTILVVDDEPHIVEVVRDYLKQAGYRVLTASDGQTALTLARHERPDLIVLDLMLPGGADGLDVCRGVRRDPSPLVPARWWPACERCCAASSGMAPRRASYA